MNLLSDVITSKYKYKVLPEEISSAARYIYSVTMPYFLQEKSQPLYTVNGTLICTSFDRVVIGDYGAYIEFSSNQANKDAYIIAPGQEYRLSPRYSNVKYIWLTIDDESEVKIYYQRNTVKYADYQPNKYYVSVYEVYPKDITKLVQGGN